MAESTRWFSDVGMRDLDQVGGKNASLGEMIRNLKSKGIQVPDGFCTTAAAYREFIQENNLGEPLRDVLSDLDTQTLSNLRERGKKARDLILAAKLPKKLVATISECYEKLCKMYPKHGSLLDVAIRSSATAEDLPQASFAGQQETYLNVHGTESVLRHCLMCYASLFTDRAISYRVHNGFDHFDVALSVGIQMMVRSDEASSGVIFTIDTETGFKDLVLVTGAYGLGETVVQGTVNPDEFVVFKPTLRSGHEALLDKRRGSKEIQMVYSQDESKMTETIPVPKEKRCVFCITDQEALQLATWACSIEEHYSALRGKPCPMDIEWAKDGRTGDLFIVQARPETVQSLKEGNVLTTYEMERSGTVLVEGKSVGEMIGSGAARVVKSINEIHEFNVGDVLVTERTDPDWEAIMKKAGALVTNQGGRTCHAAIIAREMGIPAIVGCSTATSAIKDKQEVTVSCAEGSTGKVYGGKVPYKTNKVELSSIPEIPTDIMMNVGNPEEAFSLSHIPNSGIGLARLEFIIANHIQVHPKALLHFDQVKDAKERAAIEQLVHGYEKKEDYFVDKLASGIAMIGAAFHPKPVIVRLSDFKTNEYANLLGGSYFEPKEENPMIGWRGASRYYDANYKDAFGLECRAMKRVRDKMGLTNVIPMIPFCRTPEEGQKVIDVMASYGLKRGENGLQVYVMCEIPSNVILVDEFSKVFDGFSIGSNDLTQLTLGLDRDSGLVAHVFDERHPAILKMVRMAIEGAKRNNRKIGICGQAPSDFPEFAEFLVEHGIDSISLIPDTVLKTIIALSKMK